MTVDVRPRLVIGVWALSVVSVILLRTAWIGDDAWFTFRTIDNFLHGFGLRWNAAERVQAYTHPLWMLLLTPFHWLAGEPFFTNIAVSIVLTLITLWRLIACAPSSWSAATAALILALSSSFVDYSTSGLENPLSNLLIVTFFSLHLAVSPSPVRLSVAAGLLMFNRVDLGLLVLPSLAASLRGHGIRRAAAAAAIGFMPLAIWELFSLVYYGFPFPNTAYAKLGSGIPRNELLAQGLTYLLDGVLRDPLTPVTIIAGLAWAGVNGSRGSRSAAAGILAFLAYVVWSGGDFMAGRMMVAPLVCAVMILVAADFAPANARWALMPVVVALGLMATHPPLTRDPRSLGDGLTATGITDERGFYFGANGLINYSRETVFPGGNDQVNGIQTRERGVRILEFGQNGIFGYYAGPTVHIIDPFGLGDPLLSRLPATRPWRAGHFRRVSPPGYRESLESGTNQIQDSSLAAYYERLSLIVRGPMWDRERFMTIIRMNLGQYDRWLPKQIEITNNE